jgi:acetyl-CoA decarbonylase/synthase complex subunit delta
MAFDVPKTTYSGKIREIVLGSGDKKVRVGGETAYPFHLFEGDMPCLPKIAMEVWDIPPEDWSEAALEPFSGVTDDPVAWAKKCVDDYDAEMIALQLPMRLSKLSRRWLIPSMFP